MWKGELSRAHVLEDIEQQIKHSGKAIQWPKRPKKQKQKKKPTNSGIVLVIYVVNLLFDAVV